MARGGVVILDATGHRPGKLGGYGEDVWARLRKGARSFLERERNATAAISGMALGWDTALALAALDLGVPLTAAVPFSGLEKSWPAASQRRSLSIMERDVALANFCPGGFAAHKMKTRNEWMVPTADTFIPLFAGFTGHPP